MAFTAKCDAYPSEDRGTPHLLNDFAHQLTLLRDSLMPAVPYVNAVSVYAIVP